MLTCPAAHIGAQAYAVLIDSYGGYILESFVAHSVKKTKKRKRQRGKKKEKKAAPKEKRKEKREGEFFSRSACVLFSPCAEILLLVELGPGRV